MTSEFEMRKQQLKEKYEAMSPIERKELKRLLKQKNLLAYRHGERIKRELLRLEARRAQMACEHDNTQLSEIEERIIQKKEQFLKILYDVKNRS
ncbi:hypothetical protein IGI37_001862 [Enterococcus sp. AZ194]|uniref:hypothetical protein n=1 Tax=Enterococcus sp. AZ194 TaxID=2774629 RepID=UPI003F1F07AA